MAKEWILNSVMNRFQLDIKRKVGDKKEITNKEVIEDINKEIERLKYKP